MWYVYVLKSKRADYSYIGSTNDLGRRLCEHNNGSSPATAPYAPFIIGAYIAVPTEKQARSLELYFKTGSGKAILNKRILGLNPLADEALA